MNAAADPDSPPTRLRQFLDKYSSGPPPFTQLELDLANASVKSIDDAKRLPTIDEQPMPFGWSTDLDDRTVSSSSSESESETESAADDSKTMSTNDQSTDDKSTTPTAATETETEVKSVKRRGVGKPTDGRPRKRVRTAPDDERAKKAANDMAAAAGIRTFQSIVITEATTVQPADDERPKLRYKPNVTAALEAWSAALGYYRPMRANRRLIEFAKLMNMQPMQICTWRNNIVNRNGVVGKPTPWHLMNYYFSDDDPA